MNTRTAICKDCGDVIAQVFEKALDGETAVVWTASIGGWICEATGDEHEPEGLDSTYQRDLDFATEGMTASELLVDAVFNDVVENHGHSRTRIERDLRACAIVIPSTRRWSRWSEVKGSAHPLP